MPSWQGLARSRCAMIVITIVVAAATHIISLPHASSPHPTPPTHTPGMRGNTLLVRMGDDAELVGWKWVAAHPPGKDGLG